VTADEAYGQVKYLRVWLEDHDAWHVLVTKVNDTVITTGGAERRMDELIAALPARAWRRLSAGAGAHGPRDYDWARLPIRIGWRAGRGHWLLARRPINAPNDPGKIAYYICYGPRRSTLLDLARIAGTRWPRRGMLPTSQERSRPGPLPGPHLAGLERPHHVVHARPRLARRRENPCGKREPAQANQA
jgi:hypothetical protein